MDLKHFEQKLLEKRTECQGAIAALTGEARETAAGIGEVRDPTDDATLAQGTSQALEESAILARTLEQVEDALGRIADGTYGTCTRCGRQIAQARLEAIPWTPYCMEDQEKIDRAGAAVRAPTL